MNAAIIQVRVNSSRLPGKVLLKVKNKTLLEHLILRVKESKKIDEIIIATTKNKLDDQIEKFCIKNEIKFFRGDENDVLSRYFESAKQFKIKTIIRLTGDTPLIDPSVIDDVINFYEKHNFEYVSNFFPFPRLFPDGYNVEVFSFEILKKCHLESTRPSEREHVTPYITMQPKEFSIGKFECPIDLSKYRFNLDYYEDFLLIEKILENLYSEEKIFSMDDIIQFLDKNPEIFKINAHILSYSNILKSFDDDKKLGFEPREGNYYFNSQ